MSVFPQKEAYFLKNTFKLIDVKCVQLNWSSILLDGYKKHSLPRQPSREACVKECKDHRLYRATPPGRDTVKG